MHHEENRLKCRCRNVQAPAFHIAKSLRAKHSQLLNKQTLVLWSSAAFCYIRVLRCKAARRRAVDPVKPSFWRFLVFIQQPYVIALYPIVRSSYTRDNDWRDNSSTAEATSPVLWSPLYTRSLKYKAALMSRAFFMLDNKYVTLKVNFTTPNQVYWL